MSDNILTLTDDSFECDVLQSQHTVLVDFWAPWCGPCKMLTPILDEVAQEYAGRITIAKLDVDDNQLIASKYGIRGIPTLMVFKQGEVVATKVSTMSKSQLIAFIEPHLL